MNPALAQHRRSGRSWLAQVCLSSALVAAGAGCDAGGDPHIDSVAPARGAAGTVVTITGRGFCGARAGGAYCGSDVAGYVDFNLDPPSVRAAVSSWNDTRIEISVPQSVARGGTELFVTVDGSSSNSAEFEVL